MKAAPQTMGELRKMLAETLQEVRYGHMDPQRGAAVAKLGGQIANLIHAEIDAWKYLAEVGAEVGDQRVGALPINGASERKVISG